MNTHGSLVDVALNSGARDSDASLTGDVKSDSSTATGTAYRDGLDGRCTITAGPIQGKGRRTHDGESAGNQQL